MSQYSYQLGVDAIPITHNCNTQNAQIIAMAATGGKRTLLEVLTARNPTLWIKLPSAERLPAQDVLAWSSSVVQVLPPGDGRLGPERLTW